MYKAANHNFTSERDAWEQNNSGWLRAKGDPKVCFTSTASQLPDTPGGPRDLLEREGAAQRCQNQRLVADRKGWMAASVPQIES